MRKEKWLLKEIESWKQQEIVSEELAERLQGMYRPQKSVNFLTVLFAVVGSILIGMGIVLVSANNWWYSLPLVVKTVIGFLPLVLSQAVVLFVYRCKMQSTAFRESAALLNMAGVFASIALVGQIFHLPGDFTNYLLVCGVLFLPTMLVLDAVSPFLIYCWTAINGGIWFSDELGIVISVVMFLTGAVFSLRQCHEKNAKSVYLSLVTAISGLVLLLASALKTDGDLSVVLYGYSLLLLSAAPLQKGSEEVFSSVGKLLFLVLTLIVTYQGLWEYVPEFDSVVFLILTLLIVVCAVALFIRNMIGKRYCPFSLATVTMLVLRGIWCIFTLNEAPFPMIFMIFINVMLLVFSIFCIFMGARRLDLYHANIGMIALCTLIVLRFFDSGLPLAARGIVFLVLGAGFLLLNGYLVKGKKRKKEETV